MKGEWGSRFRVMSRHTDAVLAVGVFGLILLLMIPVPPFLLDALLCLSIVLSVMVLLITLYVENALEFSAFPSVLLFLTLFRLGLNVASTRMILTQGECGDIIKTFGSFVIRGNEAVGLILFLLLTLINFVVVTKGAGRIAEVAARFTLEALPGKQMAVDGELNAGLITQSQAKEERKKISAETDFYGAMDGASKFVKGDAVIGLIITGVNILGGLFVGIFLKGLTWQNCWSSMIRLTIGDGLSSQIPALLISVGAAMMVTRASTGSLGKTLPKQIFRQPKILIMTGILILLLSLIPGMPFMIMGPLSALLFMGGYFQLKASNNQKKEKQEACSSSLLVPPIEIQLGYQAVLLAESIQNAIKEIRQTLISALGIRLPSAHIADKVDLSPNGWAIFIRGVPIAHGRDAELAPLTKKLREIIHTHAHELINRQDVAMMLQEAKLVDSAVVDELFPKKISLGQILKVLQNLLKEGVPIGDFVTILELLADHAKGEVTDIEALTEEVRNGLASKISDQFFGKTRNAHVITIDPKVEQMLSVAKGSLRPKTIEQLSQELMQLHEKGLKKGVAPVVLTTTSTRAALKRLIEKQIPNLPVLSYKEIAPDIKMTTLGEVSNKVLI